MTFFLIYLLNKIRGWVTHLHHTSCYMLIISLNHQRASARTRTWMTLRHYPYCRSMQQRLVNMSIRWYSRYRFIVLLARHISMRFQLEWRAAGRAEPLWACSMSKWLLVCGKQCSWCMLYGIEPESWTRKRQRRSADAMYDSGCRCRY